ncbi:MAG TPA: protease pro-enzyme activation domain-containing protein [Streptosporangiaceae bacterium]
MTGLAQASPKPAETVLAGSAASFTSHTRVTGNVAAATALTVQLWLKPDIAAAARYAVAVSTPGSRMFRHYLSPAAYTARFGATKATASRVESWLRSQGFTAIRTDAQRNYVRATASTAKINAAFRVQLKTYQSSKSVNAGPYALRANDRAVSLPSSVAASVLGVTGLDNAAPIIPLIRQAATTVRGTAVKNGHVTPSSQACSQFYGQNIASHLPGQFGVTSFPTEVCGYSGTQLRAAYGSTSGITGKGQKIALVELGLAKDMFLTLQDYAAANGVPAPSSERYAELSLGQGTACGDEFAVEEQLDVESSYDMAPSANQLVVGGDSCNQGDFGLQGLFDADTAVLNGPLATVVSNSWESGSESQPTSNTDIEHAYLVRAAAEGVGMYFSSGDGSGVLAPSDDPFSIAVGGTTLGIGQAGNRLFETGWSTGLSFLEGNSWVFAGEQGAAGGGPSLLWKQPAYQVGVVPASLSKVGGNRGKAVRSIPDISADADPFTGMAVGILRFKGGVPTYHQIDIGGTSEASPLVAGIVAAAQQGQSAPFGFVDPALYQLSGTSAYFDSLPLTSSSPALWKGTECPAFTCGAQILTTFDDENPAMAGYTGQVTLPGYDNMTGLGSPNGPKFISSLRKIEG